MKQYLLGVRDIEKRITALEKYPKEQAAAKRFKNTVVNQIHGLQDNRHVALLEYRYIEGMTWDEVTDKMEYYNSDYVRRHLHLAALKEFEKKYPKYEKDYPYGGKDDSTAEKFNEYKEAKNKK